MKLYVKQKVFSWINRFSVYYESGAIAYSVEGEAFSWGHKLHVYDAGNVEVALIQQRLWQFLPKYSVFSGDVELFQIVKEFSFMRPYYRIEGMDWQVSGEFWAHDYTISSGEREVATIR